MADVQNDPTLEIRLLGSVQAHYNGRELDLGGMLPKSLLTALILSPGQTLPKDTMIEALWGADPPLTADRLIADYLSRLRTVLAPAGEAIRLRAMRPGFRAELDPLAVDAHRLRDLIRHAERDRAAGDDEHAATLLRQALDLWPTDTPALADLESTWLRAEARRLRGWRLDALEHLARLHLNAGHPEQAAALLRDTAPSPERENLTAAVIEALLGTGERTRATALARSAHESLKTRGKQPGIILRSALDTALGTYRDGRQLRGPRQLPRDIALFTGRSDELGQLLALAAQAASGHSPGTVVISAIDGMGGVGKTALAIRAAHRLAEHFPDGQLFLDLYGFTQGTMPREPGDALAALLSSLGVLPQQMPAGLDARAAFYRDRLAGTRTLIVLDNAADEAQVAPLLPADAGCLVLVTSRKRLTTLDDALPLPLDVLPLQEAVTLLRKAARLDEHPQDELLVEQAAELCGRLPLALLIAGALLRTGGRAWNLTLLINRLAARLPGKELAGYSDGTRNLAAVFDLSYDALREDQRLLFRQLGLLPGPELDAYGTAALLDISLDKADDLLQHLADNSLLIGASPGRYRIHDLVRAHARSLVTADPQDHRDTALTRLLDYYQYTAQQADSQIARYPRPKLTNATPTYAPEVLEVDAAMTWLRIERDNLEACLGEMIDRGWGGRLAAMTVAASGLLRTDGSWQKAIGLYATALDIVRRFGDELGSVSVLIELGTVQRLSGDHPGAIETLQEAEALCRRLNYRLGQAAALSELGAAQHVTGDHANSVRHLEVALMLYREAEDLRGQASVLLELGSEQRASGNLEAAVRHLEVASELYRSLGHRRGQSAALTQLATARKSYGDYSGATSALEAALEVFQKLGSRLGQANALAESGSLRQLTGDLSGASRDLSAAVDLYNQLGDPLGQANAQIYLGDLFKLTGDPANALQSTETALALYRQTGSRGGEVWALNHYAAIFLANADLTHALPQYRNALHLAQECHQFDDEALALEGIGECLLASDEAEEGTAHLRRALGIYLRLGMRPDIERVQTRLANVTDL